MKHINYVTSNRLISNGKTGSQLIYFDANGSTLKSLVDLGFNYYCKKHINPFGSNMIVQILSVLQKDNKYYCILTNTINMIFFIEKINLYKIEN